MNTLAYVQDVVIPAAYSLLPPKMNSPEATGLLLAIGLQESRFQHRRQIGGPARGFWQFEEGGGVLGVLRHHETTHIVVPILNTLQYPDVARDVWMALEHNDVLACVFARLNLWWHPKPLPKVGDVDAGWHYYTFTWRPGKPHRQTWDDFAEQAWAMV